jgi:hypothetical protein
MREDDGLQIDFMGTIHGIRSFEGVRDRASIVEIDSVPILVASLADVIRSKKPARVLAIWRFCPSWRERLKKRREQAGRKAKLAAVARESERNVRDLIRRWQALPPGRRTHFLRKRVGTGRTTL